MGTFYRATWSYYLLTTVLLAGCQDTGDVHVPQGMVNVSGEITLDDKPLTSSFAVIVPESQLASGDFGDSPVARIEKGKFQCFLAPGKYVMRIHRDEGAEDRAPAHQEPELLEDDLRLVVPEGKVEESFSFNLKSKP
ncbi:MAG: hypothetical protein WD045_00770 [Pirellulaceae bacterium]